MQIWWQMWAMVFVYRASSLRVARTAHLDEVAELEMSGGHGADLEKEVPATVSDHSCQGRLRGLSLVHIP
eukprot:9461756-Ditylum_brightwellii.AAC.1